MSFQKVCDVEGCENLVEGRTLMCASHNHEARKQERLSTKVKVVQPVKKITAKHTKELVDYGVLRRIYLQEHPECEIQIPGICDGQATSVHHCAKRGVNLLKSDTFKSACGSCHTYIETKMSAEQRREKGFLLSPKQTV